MKKNIIFTFLTTFFIIFVAYGLLGYISYRTFLTSDLSVQYYHFLYMFKEVLEGTSNFLYSFKIGIGNSFFDVFLYYLNSPFNIILKFISYENIYSFIIYSVMLRISLCSCTMYIFMNYHFKNEKFLPFFAICYALSSTIISNYLQIMWLDVYILAPLVLLGIDKIIQNNKPLIYLISLSLIIFLNYYLGFIVCVFSIMYFLYRLFLYDGKKWIIVKTFLISSFLAGMLTMLTNFTELLSIINFGRDLNFHFSFNSDPVNVISSLFIWNNQNFPVLLNYSNPKLYIGILLIIFLFVYFFSKNINKKEKLISGIFLFVILLFILFNPLNLIWHAFSEPVGFNFRYIFLVDIFIIYLSYKGFKQIDLINLIYYFLILYLILILIVCCSLYNFINTKYLFLSLIFIILYIIILCFKKKYLLFLLLLLELFLNVLIFNSYISPIVNPNVLTDDNILEMVNIIKEKEQSKFYRMDFSNLDSIFFNENILYDYNGATAFVSTIPSDLTEFFDKVGYEMRSNTYLFKNYYIINSILGIKYYADTKGYDKVIGNYGNYNIYINDNALSLGFVVSDSVKKDWNCNSAFDCQQKILNMMNDNNVVFYENIDFKKINDYEYEIENFDKSIKYFDFSFDYEKELDIELYINNQLSGNFFKAANGIFKTTGIIFNNDDTFNIKIVDKNGNLKNVQLFAYKFNYKLYEKEISKLSERQLNIIEFSSTNIKGTIDGSGTLFTSIPYSKYWKIYVDGNKVETYKIFDAFLGVDISAGNHFIEIKYEVDTFKYGIFISSCTLLISIFYIFKFKKY